MIKRVVILMAAVMMTIATALAQMPKAVDWSMNFKKIGANEGVLTVYADVADGWHLYGTTLPEGGPSATSIKFVATKGVKVDAKLTPSLAPVKVNDPMFGMELNWWDQPVSFSCKVSLKDAPKNWVIKAEINNMACNDQTCIPPVKTELEVTSAGIK